MCVTPRCLQLILEAPIRGVKIFCWSLAWIFWPGWGRILQISREQQITALSQNASSLQRSPFGSSFTPLKEVKGSPLTH